MTWTTAAELEHQLPPEARTWLAEARQQSLGEVFPAVARAVGRAQLPTAEPARSAGSVRGAEAAEQATQPTVDLVVRGLLLVGVGAGEVLEVYRFGDAAEKHAVLWGLGVDEVEAGVGDQGLSIVADAIRTNDQRLLAAALGPYATKWLPQVEFRQAVLKCVFAGVPLEVVDGLPERADAELTRMMKDFAAERTAAGREVPADLQPYLTVLRGV